MKKPEASFLDKVKSIGKTIGLNMLTGGAYTAVPALENIVKGEATSEDWAVFAVPALEATGLIVPPSGVEGDVGRGLEIGQLQLSYANTVLGVDALLADDLGSFFKNQIALPYIEGKLKQIDWELPESVKNDVDDWQAYWDTVPSDIKAGISTTVGEMRKGASFEDAASDGLVQWAESAGYRDRIEDALGDAASNFDDEFLQPFKNKVDNIVNVDGAKKFLSNFDDNTLQQVTKPIGDAGSAVEDAFESTGLKEPLQEAGRKIDDYLLQPAKDALLTGGGALVAQPSATRTTDSLFRDELFKFKEKDFGLVGRVEQAPQELVEDIDSNPFASDFDNRNLFG